MSFIITLVKVLNNGAPRIYDAHDFYQGLLPDNDGTVLQRRWIPPYLKNLRDQMRVKR